MPQLHEEQTNSRRALNNDDSSDEENWAEEDDFGGEPFVCLFCQQQFVKNHSIPVEHLRSVHSVDLVALKGQLNMDQYSFIRVS